MRGLLKREFRREDYTIGRVYIDGEFFCHSLEPRDRCLQQKMELCDIQRLKVAGKTAIPSGIYEVRMTWSKKYGRRMPQLLDVPGFTGIRIHAGNSASDTAGCILLGDNTVAGGLTGSGERCREFERRLKASAGKCYIEIR